MGENTQKCVTSADAGDYHFLLMKDTGGTFHCIRHPTDDFTNQEELIDPKEIPEPILDSFKKHM